MVPGKTFRTSFFCLWVAALWLPSFCAAVNLTGPEPALRVIFDDVHGQAYGNADWLPTTAYSELASDLVQYLNASIDSVKSCSRVEEITGEMLQDADVLIIPEPNIRFSPAEIHVIREFVTRGGGLFAVADHGGSDRNMDGWDSCLILNEIVSPWGLYFLGDTWSEAPVRGWLNRTHPVMRGVQAAGAWAAASMIIPDAADAGWVPLIVSGQTGHPFCVAGEVRAGRVIAIGDSSPFDDGSGEQDKNRHNSYISWLFQHPALAVQSVAWLAGRESPEIPAVPPPLPLWPSEIHRETDAGRRDRWIIDAAHGNADVDVLERFCENVARETGIVFYINTRPIGTLQTAGCLLVFNPTLPLHASEIDRLSQWVRSGGKLVLCTGNGRNPLSAIPVNNELLQAMGSGIRCNADEVMDWSRNTGKPWSVLATGFHPSLHAETGDSTPIRSAVFWGSCSLMNLNNQPEFDQQNITVLAWSSEKSVSRVYDWFQVPGGIAQGKKSLPLAAMETIGKGCVVVIGANTFTDYQYPTDEEKAGTERIKWDHDTAKFNLAIVNILKE